ncbi:hypothetical protein [Streptomyces beihaiensis]|uniref:ABC transporter permease n=1 Tax=Streptomyces beihaiensis TaxID=2984495 RepID=A0ABT3TYN8_9ACTN|nr:hypothetical protein [Streptomyces beihaiensis]MCX3062167.1 hypothetical protein [Streptomyces beihaiensis]
MSATATTTPPAPGKAPAPVRRTLPGPDGLVWTMLRLHRKALWVWTGYVAVSAGLLLWLWGPRSSAVQKAFDTFGYAGAQDNAWRGSFTFTFNYLFYAPLSWTRIAAVALAVFAAGPLIGRELESGTAKLVWTQSVSPARWLAAKLALPALCVTVGTTLVVVVYRLVWDGRNHLLIAGIGPRDFAFSVGPATVVNALAGLALGALAALLVRRVLPAVTLAGAATFLVGAARGNSWPFQGSYQQPELPVHSRAITSAGAEVRDPGCELNRRCLEHHDITGFTRHYLPSPDYWPRQLAETGILLALTALAVAASFLVLRRYGPGRVRPTRPAPSAPEGRTSKEAAA